MNRLLTFLALVCSLSAFPQEIPQPENYTLNNGLKIYLLHYGKIQAVSVKLMVNTGKKNETPGQQGYSSITTEMLLKGNTKYTEEAQNDTAFKLGGQISVESDYDYTMVNAGFLTKDFDQTMDLFSSAILHPLFNKDKLDQEISFLSDFTNSSKMDISELATVFSELFIYGTSNPLGRFYYKIQLQQLTREKLKDYYDFNFTPKNCSIMVCGNFDPAEVKSVVDKYFGSWKSVYGEVNGVSLENPSLGKKEVAFINRTHATQCALEWNKTAPSVKDKDYLAFTVANQLFQNKLFEEIRGKEGKTYSIESEHLLSRFSNMLVISCSVRKEEMLKTINLMDKTLQDFSLANFTREDFDKAQLSIKVNRMNSEMPGEVLDFYNPVKYDFQKRKNFLNDLAALKTEDLQKVIKKYFTPDVYKLVIAGDENEIREQLSALKGLIRFKPEDIQKDN